MSFKIRGLGVETEQAVQRREEGTGWQQSEEKGGRGAYRPAVLSWESTGGGGRGGR